MLNLPDFIKAKLKKFDTLSDKDRDPSEKHGLQIIFSGMTLPADQVAMLDGSLRAFLFMHRPPDGRKQSELDGMETEVLTKAGEKVGTIKWEEELTGYTLVIDYGAGGRSNIELTDCKVHGIRWRPKQGGWEIKTLKVDTPNATEKIIGKVGVLKSTEVSIKLLPPEVADDLVDGAARTPAPPAAAAKTAKASKKDGQAKTPEQALAETAPAAATTGGAVIHQIHPRSKGATQ